MAQLKEGYRSRPATKDDTKSLVDLFNEYWEELTGIVKFSLEDMQNIFSTPGFDMETSLRVVLSPQGEIVASGFVADFKQSPHPPQRLWLRSQRPRRKRSGHLYCRMG